LRDPDGIVHHVPGHVSVTVKFRCWFPASRIIPWARSGSGPASPGRVSPEPEGPIPAS
ncbi:unnamed protein product, partial [Brassica napus]